MNQVQKLLIIGFVWPEPNSSAAGGRMMQLISLFKADGFSITFASSAQNSDFIVDLYEYGVERKSIELNNSSFDVFIKDLNPTVVLFDLAGVLPKIVLMRCDCWILRIYIVCD